MSGLSRAGAPITSCFGFAAVGQFEVHLARDRLARFSLCFPPAETGTRGTPLPLTPCELASRRNSRIGRGMSFESSWLLCATE